MSQPVEAFKEHAAHLFDDLKRELVGIRTNRPSAGLVEDLKVSYYGELLPMKQVASITVVPPREIDIQVWDKEAVSGVLKAIEASSLGLTAKAEGNVVRLYLPELSEERRAELVKHVKRVAEEHRIVLRHLRDEVNKKLQKSFDDHEINEDQKFALREEVQDHTELVNGDIESLVGAKVAEISR